MKPSEVLKKFGWCRRALALDGEGKDADIHSEEAKMFCLLGAIERAYDMEDTKKSDEAKSKLSAKLESMGYASRNGVHISVYNDIICQSAEEAISILEEIGE